MIVAESVLLVLPALSRSWTNMAAEASVRKRQHERKVIEPLDPVPVDELTGAVKPPVVPDGWKVAVTETGEPVNATSPFGSEKLNV